MHTPTRKLAVTHDADGSGERWLQLVSGLRSMLPQMQTEFVERVQGIDEYADQAVDLLDLQQSAFDSISLVIDAMAGSQHYPRMLRFSSELGTRRARQGLSAHALMSAVRLNFPIIWSALLAEAKPEDAQLMSHRVEEVWQVVDEYAETMRASYTDTRIRMAQEEAGVRQEFISALFGAQGQLAETRDRFAKAFGVDSEAAYSIAAANGQGAAQLRQLVTFPGLNKYIFVHETDGLTYAFWPEALPTAPLRAFRPTGLDSIACGLARSDDGLAGLAAAARVSAALAELVGPADATPTTIDQEWPRLARTRMDTLGVELSVVLDRQLKEARPAEMERLRETIQCYLANGSVSATAAELFCHRNTILNRLRLFREITGLDMTVPAQAARVVIAWS